jgi:PAS domain S-box-containing protein
MINTILSHIDHKSLFNALSEGIVYVQPDGIITFMNTEAKKIFANFPHFAPGEHITSIPYRLRSKRGEELSIDEFAPLIALRTNKPVRNSIVQLISDAQETLWIDLNADPVEITAEFSGVIVTIVELNDLMEEKQRLRQEEEKLRSFFRANEAATLLATIDGRCLSISAGAERMFGYTGDDWKGEARSTLFIQDEAFAKALKLRDETGSVIAEITGRRKSGETFPLLWQSNIFTTTGGLRLVSAVMHDISQQKEMSREVTRASFNLDLILKNTNEGFLITDNAMNIVACNESMIRMIRALSGSEIKNGDNLMGAIAPHRRELATKIMTDALQGIAFDDQLELEEEGVEKVYHMIVRPLYEGDKIIGTFLQRRDVTERSKMQERLRVSNERFELATKSSFDMIWEYDIASDMVHFSDAMEKVFKHFVASPVNREWYLKLIVSAEDEKDFRQRIDAFRASSADRWELPVHRLMKGDGTIAFVKGNAVKVYDRFNNLQKIIGVLRDVTDSYKYEQQLIENNQRFAMVKKATKDVVFEFNGMEEPLNFSEALFYTFGYQPEELGSTSDLLQRLVHPEDLPVVQAAGFAFGSGTDNILALPDFRMLHKDGSVVFVEVKFIGVRNEHNTITKGYGNIKNITDRHLMHERLEKLNEELRSQAADLRKSNEDLERFAYVASHDLQEPLRMVSSFLGLIRKRYNDLLDDTGRQYIHFAVDGAERMKKLILDLLDYSRISGGPTVNHSVDLNNLCNEVLAEYKLAIEEKKAVVKIDLLPNVVGNAGLLTHVFRNLIGNALKYSESEPEINIGYINGDDHLVFVSDNGIGIDPKYFDKIFIIFQQLHSRSEKGGTGMGLAIAKRIVERHNGKLWVESEEGKGSTFYFTLPKTSQKQDESASADITSGR